MMTAVERETLLRESAERSPVPWFPVEYAAQLSGLSYVWVKLIQGGEWKYQIASYFKGLFFPIWWGTSVAKYDDNRIEWFKPDNGRLGKLQNRIIDLNFRIEARENAIREILGKDSMRHEQ